MAEVERNGVDRQADELRWEGLRFNVPLDIGLYAMSGTIFFAGLITQPAVSKHRRRVVSHPDSSQSHQAHLTMLQ